ncbi:hypothetical protein QBZ16_002137 [Prototheca wickerhamii]|uniref:tryptophan--tRNA ligase n=1 Tax=Prototheca wickerhamii TaxID=3111 RepID=A0AAD9MJE0_PROWI|nr:hypothetical protein QBZ16_002137 [Prototheca wickerhamii]
MASLPFLVCRPTGNLHLGNYLGAVKEWSLLQHDYDAFFCVVDMHAITVAHDPAHLRDATRSVAATYLAAGIDPGSSTIFVQSHVPAHSELTWLLSCATPLGWLRKMVQFKEKSQKTGFEEASTGILTYPADLVPVGEDQRQHLELTRDIVIRMNRLYGGNKAKRLGCSHGRLFTMPEASIPVAGARCMSLQDGTKKMSKSAESDFSRINLSDDPDLIRQKIQRAKTDSFATVAGDPGVRRPEAENLLGIYRSITGKSQVSACLLIVAGKRCDRILLG